MAATLGLGLDQRQIACRTEPTKIVAGPAGLFAARQEGGVGPLHLLGDEEVPLAGALDDAPRPRGDLRLDGLP